MKRLMIVALSLILTFYFTSLKASGIEKKITKIKARKVSEEELKAIFATTPSIPIQATEACSAGNTNYAYTITNMLFGTEHFSAFVDPEACYVSTPGVVRATSINIVLYATADINLCSGFEMQAHIEAAEWSGSCPSPGYEAQCTSDYTVMQITSPGLYLISFPLNEDCLRFGPFFASITFFNDGGCLPGPLNIVVDDWPEYCNSYNNYDGTWYDIVASYGLVGKLSLFATLEGINPVPTISSIEDVPYDQGGELTLKWRKSLLDSALFSSVTHYAIWRRLPYSEGNNTYSNNSKNLSKNGSAYIPPEFEGYATRAGYDGSVWEWIANVPSHSFDKYAFTAKSLYDSTGSDPHWQYFMVTAYTDDPFIYWDSPVDSGYSVDNLAPAPPENLTGRELESNGGLFISWSASKESDLKCYNLYRGEGEDFLPSNEKLIASTIDTSFVDTCWNPGSHFCYKLEAVDVHGNASQTAQLKEQEIIVGTELISFTSKLSEGAIAVQWKTSSEIKEHRIYKKTQNQMYSPISLETESYAPCEFLFIDREVSPGRTYRYRICYLDDSGNEHLLFETKEISLPQAKLTLSQNHPNPFNPSTVIEFYLPQESKVHLMIFDSEGAVVRELISGARLSGGLHRTEWDGKDTFGKNVSSGVYYYMLGTERGSVTKKMVLIR